MVGRDAELSQLIDVADRSVEVGAQFVLVSGEAGIGKSTLIGRVTEELADSRWAIHTGHCIEYADRALPFGPIVSIIRSVLADVGRDADVVIGHHRADLAALIPELAAEGVNGASLSGDVDRLIDAISTMLIRASERRPMTLIVEDIHWADAATRDLLATLVHSLGSARMLLLVSERTGAVPRGHLLHTWLAELRRFPNVTSIMLRGLSRDALIEQAANILGEPLDADLAEELERRTGGNAYFASELLLARRFGGTALPTSLADFLTSRVARLETDEQEVLRALAIAGGPASFRTLASMLPDLTVGPLIRSLFDASLIVVDGTNYAFGHALMREAILRNVLPFEAEELHRRAAEAIANDPSSGRSPTDLATLAVHWAQANDPERSLVASIDAARASAAVAAYDQAADLAMEALRSWVVVANAEELTGITQDQLSMLASDWLVASNRSPEASELLNAAVSGLGTTIPDGRRALLLAKLAPIRFQMGLPNEATRLLSTAVDLVGDEVSPEAAQVHHRASKLAVLVGSIRPAMASADQAIAIASQTGPETILVEALTTKALGLGVTESLEAGVEMVRDARERAKAEKMVSQVAFSYRTEMMIINYRAGRTEESLEILREGLRFADQHCGPSLRLDIQHDLSLGLVEAGQLEEAGPIIDGLLSATSESLRKLTILQTAALRSLLAGDLDQAADLLKSAKNLSEKFESAQETGFQYRLEAELARRRHRFDDALRLIDAALELQLASDNVTFTRESMIEKCRLVRAISIDAPERAIDLRTTIEPLLGLFESGDQSSTALADLMRLELRLVDTTVEAREAKEILDALASSGFGAEAAQAALLHAELLAGEGPDEAEIVAALVDLRALGRASGMHWLIDGADRITQQLGVAIDLTDAAEPIDIRESDRSVPEHGLTAREVEVLSLLARGMTNKEIGAELYVSHRTVSTHVSNLLAKLHLKNRSEAAATYHRLGFADSEL